MKFSGANGRTGKDWKKLLPYIRSRLGTDCNVSSELKIMSPFELFVFLVYGISALLIQ